MLKVEIYSTVNMALEVRKSYYCVRNSYYCIVINIVLLISMANDRAIYPCIYTLSIKCMLHKFKYEYLM